MATNFGHDQSSLTPNAIRSLTTNINALTLKLEPYTGDESGTKIQEFISDLRKYLEATGKSSECEKKQVLRMHLKGAAKVWFRSLDPDDSFETFLDSLIKRFSWTDTQLHAKRINMYRASQQPGETFLAFVTRVLDKSRGLNISQDNLLNIFINGADCAIRPFLICKSHEIETIDDLLALPLCRDENAMKGSGSEFVGLTDLLQTTKPTETWNSSSDDDAEPDPFSPTHEECVLL